MECGECGAAWSDVDMENAQDAFRWYNEFWGHLNWWERIKAVWGMRGFPRNGTEHEFKFTGSSRRHWNYGTESEDWTEFYECSCGERLDYDNGWSLQA